MPLVIEWDSFSHKNGKLSLAFQDPFSSLGKPTISSG